MSRLPTPGGDVGVWSEILNDYLLVSHTATGMLNDNTVGASQIVAGSISDAQVNNLSQSKITNLQSDMNGLSGKNVALISRAVGFVQEMLKPLTQITTPSMIYPAHAYGSNYTGIVSGTFDLLGTSPAVEQLCPVNVATPVGSIPDSYFGTVTGTITNYSQLTSGPYTVQAYKTTDSDYAQPATATVDGSGNYSLDLTVIPSHIQGSWKFGLLNGTGTLVGQKWPFGTSYTGLTLQHSVITDASYPVASMPLLSDGTFSFLASSTGVKQFQIVDSQSNVLAQYVPPIQNVRSYLVASGEPGYGTVFPTYCYTYDQSIALLAALASGNMALAQNLVAGLLNLQTTGGAGDGAFVFSAPQLSTQYGNAYYRTGTCAFAVYGLLSYIEACPNDVTYDYISAATRGLAYLSTQLSTSGSTAGLYMGGTGTYSDPPGQPEIFNQSYSIGWAATEHNLDTWHTFNKAATVLGTSSYASQATTLQQNILSMLWDNTNQRFYQGMQPTGPDPSDPLDMHTWGAIWLNRVGETDKATQVMNDAALAPFVVTNGGVTGYATAYTSGGYPGITPSVWSEGTFGAALAFLSLGDTVNWQATIDGIAPGQRPDGSFRYVTTADTTYELTSSESTIGASWAVLAALGHGIWDISVPR
jgi:hypothetical protein